MKRKPCRAFTLSDSGKEHCQGFAGHKTHFYAVARGTKSEFTVSWPNFRARKAIGKPAGKDFIPPSSE